MIEKQAAAMLKEDINTFVEKTWGVPWPPTINKLGKESRRPSKTILNFYWYITSTENYHHVGAYDSANFLLMSFSEDLFLRIFNGKFLTLNTLQ